MEPFLEEETQTKTTNKVTFKINTNGEIEFDATGLRSGKQPKLSKSYSSSPKPA
jgi:hypothetical protein